jgi:hypothetical protein
VSCQHYSRINQFHISCSDIEQSTVAHFKQADTIIIGPLDSKVVSLLVSEKTDLAKHVASTMQSLDYKNTSADPRLLEDAGLLFYEDYQQSFENDITLSHRLRTDYVTRYPNAKWLIVTNIDGIKETQSKQTDRYNSLQAVSFKYKIWSIPDGEFAAKIGVEGYLLHSNERFVADSGSLAQRETANVLYRLVNKEYPEKAPLNELVTEATKNFAQQVKTISETSANNSQKRSIVKCE